MGNSSGKQTDATAGAPQPGVQPPRDASSAPPSPSVDESRMTPKELFESKMSGIEQYNIGREGPEAREKAANKRMMFTGEDWPRLAAPIPLSGRMLIADEGKFGPTGDPDKDFPPVVELPDGRKSSVQWYYFNPKSREERFKGGMANMIGVWAAIKTLDRYLGVLAYDCKEQILNCVTRLENVMVDGYDEGKLDMEKIDRQKLRTSEGGQLWRDIEIANSGCHHARTMHKDVYYVVEEARRTCKKYGWNGAMDDDEAIDRFEECRLFYGRDLLYANLIRTLFDYRTGACHQAAYLREIARNGHIDFSKTPGEPAVPGGVDGDDDEFEGE